MPPAEPSDFAFQEYLPDDHFVSQYLQHATELTDAYPHYHLSNALTLLSVAVDRDARIMIEPEPMFPNYWALLIGHSTVSRKSTSLNIARDVLRDADLDHKVLPEDFSPEALLDELEERPQSAFFKDEFGEFLSKRERSYQSGIGPILCDLYGNPDGRGRVLRSGSIDVENVYISLVGACVPAQIARNTSVKDIESGLFPRLLIVWPDGDKERQDRGIYRPESDERSNELGFWLWGIHTTLEGIHDNWEEEVPFYPSPEALTIFNEWCGGLEQYIATTEDGKEIEAVGGRLQDSVLKIACLLELGSEPMRTRLSNVSSVRSVSPFNSREGDEHTNETIPEFNIGVESMRAAIHLAHNFYLPHAWKLVRYIHEHEERNELRRVYKLALRHANEDGVVQHSVLLRNSNMLASDFKRCISTLKESNLLRVPDTDGQARYYATVDMDAGAEFPEVEPPEKATFEIGSDW